ncbi:putative transmembrane protein [Altererythrobacter epoxidivorans]|uniref:Putative transmembrane protein n=1 Tax=Altererythrobacter epoxidivorans TaxID=361183 RepID=A0A0M4M2N4_9SPHN|nr:hypothetical protein [Altererythrobacter epoxidivorans]ALE15678.1 putative transmembrane protein [Altererythrobacter epoxidivorans]
MASFLIPMIAVFVIALGGRDQLLVARLSDRLGQSAALLGVGAVVSAISAAAMAVSGAWLAAMMPDRAQHMLVAFALAAAAIELFWPAAPADPKEPTRSLFAIGLVLLVRQFGDAARFAIFALAAASVLAPMAGLGGAIGGAAALALGWSMGSELETRLPLRTLRVVFAIVLAIAAIMIGLSARQLI